MPRKGIPHSARNDRGGWLKTPCHSELNASSLNLSRLLRDCLRIPCLRLRKDSETARLGKNLSFRVERDMNLPRLLEPRFLACGSERQKGCFGRARGFGRTKLVIPSGARGISFSIILFQMHLSSRIAFMVVVVDYLATEFFIRQRTLHRVRLKLLQSRLKSRQPVTCLSCRYSQPHSQTCR